MAAEIYSDSTKNIWSYQKLELEDYFCLGQKFAEWDIEQGHLIIQTYGSPEYQNACRLCNYENAGISFYYHFNIIEESHTEFISGYNQVSEPYLQAKLGHNIFDSLNLYDSNKVTPHEVFELIQLDTNFTFLNITSINDTLINVKMDLDSISRKLKLGLNMLSIKVIDVFQEMESQTYKYSELKTAGVLINKHSRGKFYLTYQLDFNQVEEVCSCVEVKKYSGIWTIPITIKDE